MQLAPDDALDTHSAAGNIKPFLDELPPDFTDIVDPPVLFENALDFGTQGLIAASAGRQT